MPHLLAAITAHGYGHLAQTAPVLNALRQRLPELRLTLYTTLPRALLAKRIAGEFTLIDRAPDVGMLMNDALSVDVAASAAAYRDFHRHWQREVAAEARWLAELAPDLVFANAPYRLLAAAKQADIPALALCSLNWADVYRHVCGHRPEAPAILDQMLAAYHDAELFLQPAPSMPMSDLANRRAIGPIARLGTPRRAELAARCGAAEDDTFVLVSLGGIPMQVDASRWPRRPGLHWIVPQSWHAPRADMVAFESLVFDFVDTLRSSDALLTKPGYGSFSEAVCNSVPVLYVPRDDWPEETCLVEWLHRRGRGRAVTPRALAEGDLAETLQQLLDLPAVAPPAPSGIEEAVARLSDYLRAALRGNTARGVP